jgi:hypothetical protein
MLRPGSAAAAAVARKKVSTRPVVILANLRIATPPHVTTAPGGKMPPGAGWDDQDKKKPSNKRF